MTPPRVVVEDDNTWLIRFIIVVCVLGALAIVAISVL